LGFDFTIYNYDNRETVCHVKKHNLSDVKEIFVWVVSGDETGDLTMQDGTVYDFDASGNRVINFDDGSYIVEGKENIEKWFNFKPTEKESHLTLSYVRQDKWG
jgi:hypothetical protein